jgi:subtilisin family serine protease
MTSWRNPPWHYNQIFSTLSEIETIGWGQRLTHLPDAWKLTRGAGVRVAVLDTGCDILHPDLSGQIIAAKDFSGSSYGPADVQGHGTHCAGIIAAMENNEGCIGVCPDLKQNGGGLLIGKCLNDSGVGFNSKIADAIRWAIAEKADIISMSLGSPQTSREIEIALQLATDQGIFVICAAGNDGKSDSVNWPAKSPNTVAVAAVGEDKVVARYSSRGPEVDISAPGSNIMSTWINNEYASISGTSMATPFVAGVAALIISKHRAEGGETPVEDVAHLRDHLTRHAIDIGKKGRDDETGWGLIDPVGSLAADDPEDAKIDLMELERLLRAALSLMEGENGGDDC